MDNLNAARRRRLTVNLYQVREEVGREQVTHWTPEQIKQAYPDGYDTATPYFKKAKQSMMPKMLEIE